MVFLKLIIAGSLLCLILGDSPTARPSSVRSVYNTINAFAGTDQNTLHRGNNGKATSASFNKPYGVWQDSVGVIYFSDYNSCIRKVSTSGIISIIAGTCSGSCGSTGDNGKATGAVLCFPTGVFVTTAGTVYFADSGNNKIRTVSTSSIIATYAGNGNGGNTVSGARITGTSIYHPYSIWANSNSVFYIVNNAQVNSVSNSGIVSNYGGVSGYDDDRLNGLDGPATSATFFGPRQAIGDTTGRIYISMEYQDVVVSISSGIVVKTVGLSSTYNGENLPASAAGINSPWGIAVDSSNGDLYVAAGSSGRVQVLTAASGLVSTFAGNGVYATTGNGGYATAASMRVPCALYLNTNSELYITDQSAYVIRRTAAAVAPAIPSMTPTLSVNPTMQPTTLMPTTTAPSVSPSATPRPSGTPGPTGTRGTYFRINYVGGGGDSSNDGVSATSATLYAPYGVWQDSGSGDVYVTASYLGCIRKIDNVSIVTNVAGTCDRYSSNYPAGNGGPATSAYLYAPWGLFFDTFGVIYFSENLGLVRKITTDNIVLSFAGSNGTSSVFGDGGPATSAGLDPAMDIWGSSVGVMYIACKSTYGQVRAVDASGIIFHFAGKSGTGTSVYATSTSIGSVFGLTGDSAGHLYIADRDNYYVRRIDTTTSIISVIAGYGTGAYTYENRAATASGMYGPTDVAIDADNGDVYISNVYASRVQVVTGSTGIVTTLAGSGTYGITADGGPATSAQVQYPQALFLNTNGALYLADFYRYLVRVVSPSVAPTIVPTSPTVQPTTDSPSKAPTLCPSINPSVKPSVKPSLQPSVGPTLVPTVTPTIGPTLHPTVEPSDGPPTLPPTQKPSSLFPTSAPTEAGWITRFQHYGTTCLSDNVVGMVIYKSGVCVPNTDRYGSTTDKWGDSNGSKMYECKDGMVFYHDFNTPNCVDWSNYYGSTTITRNSTLGHCSESPYNPRDGYNDDLDVYFYSYQCYTDVEEAMSTANMTGTLVTYREYTGFEGCTDRDLMYSNISKLDYCYSDMHEDFIYIGDQSQKVEYKQSYIYQLNYTLYYYGTDDCSEVKADAVARSNRTYGVCHSAFEGLDDNYYTMDHLYDMFTVSYQGRREEPSVQPVIGSPTVGPTASPTPPAHVPSSAPSSVSNAAPSLDPTAGDGSPTVNPSKAPSIGQSVVPNPEPSVVPSVVPSNMPSVTPSVVQNTAPSRSPSCLPSGMPLAEGHTYCPSVFPSVQPSPQPSPQTAPVLSFTASTTLNGLTSPDLDKAAQDSIVNATASSMRIQTQFVNYTGSSATETTRRRLLSDKRKKGVLGHYSVVAHTSVVIPMALFTATSVSNISDPAELYLALSSALSDAVSNGAFLYYLTAASVAYGSSATASVTSTSVSVSELTVVYPPSALPTEAPKEHSANEDNSLGMGARIGIIVGGVCILVVIVFTVWWCCVRSEVRVTALPI